MAKPSCFFLSIAQQNTQDIVCFAYNTVFITIKAKNRKVKKEKQDIV